MPVFLAGEGYAKVVANTVGVPLYEFSHQDGHIMAGIYSSGSFELLENDFISVHLSGGTTEILKSRYNGFNFDNEIIGGSKDISAGQFIDRVGVKMGLQMCIRDRQLYYAFCLAGSADIDFMSVRSVQGFCTYLRQGCSE